MIDGVSVLVPESDVPSLPRTHNGGPPLDDHVPVWGISGIGNYFAWRSAYREARKPVSRWTMLRRLERAEACGLTYDEYTRVILDIGRHLQPGDTELIAKIKSQRLLA